MGANILSFKEVVEGLKEMKKIEMDFVTKLSLAIIEARDKKEMTLEVLSKITSIDLRRLKMLEEDGILIISLMEIIKVVVVLDIDFEYIFKVN